MVANFINTSVYKLNQLTNKDMFVGMLTISQITDIVKYTERRVLPIDPFEEDFDGNAAIDNQYYQRVRDSERAYQIKLFFVRQVVNMYNFEETMISPLAVFPTSVILACQSYPDPDVETLQFDDIVKKETVGNSIFEYTFVKKVNEDSAEISIPKNNHLLVVDGQHRIAGLAKLRDELLNGEIELKKADDAELRLRKFPPIEYFSRQLEKFCFLVTFLIDFDRYEQAELFTIVNFNQKPVNRSYYYDIFGSTERGKTVEKLLHDLTAFLNFNNDSPLKGCIKMLGTGKGFFSQAFLVEALLPQFRKGVFAEVASDFQSNGKLYKKLPFFFRAYFSAFLEVFNSYLPNGEGRYEDVLLKTTGMGAIIRLMPHVIKRLQTRIGPKKVWEIEEVEIKRMLVGFITPIAKNGDSYFSAGGDFSKGSGKGFQSRLYERMFNDLTSESENQQNLFI